MEKVFESLSYVQMTLIIIGQLTMQVSVPLTQVLFLIGNVIAVLRCVVLKRPIADKVKDFCMLTLSVVTTVIAFVR